MSVAFVGVVAEVKRNTLNNFICKSCCVFGITEEEHAALRAEVGQVRPEQFSEAADRYVLGCNAWRAMRILGRFGFHLAAKPLGGRVKGPAGNRTVAIYTLFSVREEEEQ